MKLPIVEMFVTLQGEGIRGGIPSLFIRFGGCSLSCPGFGYKLEKNGQQYVGCDSIHAVHKDFNDGWKFYDNQEFILQEISQLEHKFEDIVITGGEPMIHHKNPVFINLFSSLIKQYDIHVETNGTVAIDFEKYPLYKDFNLTISPKMSVSGESESKRIKMDVLKSYIANAKHTVLKVVMGKKDVLNPLEIRTFLNHLRAKVPVYIMPLGATREELED